MPGEAQLTPPQAVSTVPQRGVCEAETAPGAAATATPWSNSILPVGRAVSLSWTMIALEGRTAPPCARRGP